MDWSVQRRHRLGVYRRRSENIPPKFRVSKLVNRTNDEQTIATHHTPPMTWQHFRWLARAAFLVYFAVGAGVLLPLENSIFTLLYILLFVLSCRTVLLLQALVILTWLCLMVVWWLLPALWLFVFGLVLGNLALLWLQMHNPAPKPHRLLEVEYGC
jgi:hypothetical protein